MTRLSFKFFLLAFVLFFTGTVSFSAMALAKEKGAEYENI